MGDSQGNGTVWKHSRLALVNWAALRLLLKIWERRGWHSWQGTLARGTGSAAAAAHPAAPCHGRKTFQLLFSQHAQIQHSSPLLVRPAHGFNVEAHGPSVEQPHAPPVHPLDCAPHAGLDGQGTCSSVQRAGAQCSGSSNVVQRSTHFNVLARPQTSQM